MPAGGGGAERRRVREARDLDDLEGSARYREILAAGLVRAQSFASLSGVIWASLRRSRACDAFLRNFVRHGYQQGYPRNEVVESVLAVQKEFGQRTRLTRTWELISDWRNLQPSKLRVPLPEKCMLAVFVYSVCLSCSCSGWQRVLWMSAAITWLMGFNALLRPVEMWRLRVRCVYLHSGGGQAVLAIESPKNRKHLGAWQFTIIESSSVSAWLGWLIAELPPDARVFPGSQALLAKMFRQACAALSLDFTLGCIRPGGATERFIRDQNVAKLQFEGRWRSAYSLHHYLQVAMAKLVMNRLKSSVASRIELFSSYAAIAAQPPDLASITFFGRSAHKRRSRVRGATSYPLP